MPTKHPRVMVVLDPPLYQWVKREAKVNGTSLSLKMRDLIRQVYEDRYWTAEGARRLGTVSKKRLLGHEEFWRRAGSR